LNTKLGAKTKTTTIYSWRNVIW